MIWFGQGASFPDPLKSMNDWLNAVEKDHSDKPLAESVRHRTDVPVLLVRAKG